MHISTNLIHETFGCPLAFTELIRQYSALTPEQRAEWIESLSGVQAAAVYFVSLMYSENLVITILTMTGEFDAVAANDLSAMILQRISNAYDIDTTEDAPIPVEIVDDVLAYIETI